MRWVCRIARVATSKVTRRIAYTAISVKAIHQGLRDRKIMFAPAALSVLCAEAAVRHGTESEYTVIRKRVLPALRAANARFHVERRRMHAALQEFLQATREYCLMHPERTHAAAASMLLAALLTTMVIQRRHSQLRQPTVAAVRAGSPLLPVAPALEAPEVTDSTSDIAVNRVAVESMSAGWLDAAVEQLRKGAAAVRGGAEGVFDKARGAAAAVKERGGPALEHAGDAVEDGVHAAAAAAAEVAQGVPEQVGDLVKTLSDLVAAAPEEAMAGVPAADSREAARGLDCIARRLLSPEVLLYGMALSEMHVRGVLPGVDEHRAACENVKRGIVVSGRDVKAAVVGAWRGTSSTVAAIINRAAPLNAPCVIQFRSSCAGGV